MSLTSLKIVKSFWGYVYLEGSPEDLINVIEHFRTELGRDTEDVRDTLRILRNFDIFYDMMKRKFKDFISPRKSESDLIKGVVVIDKVKLSRDNGRKAVIVFDKRVDEETILEVVKSLGYTAEVFKE
jgi:hypothetical protein